MSLFWDIQTTRTTTTTTASSQPRAPQKATVSESPFSRQEKRVTEAKPTEFNLCHSDGLIPPPNAGNRKKKNMDKIKRPSIKMKDYFGLYPRPKKSRKGSTFRFNSRASYLQSFWDCYRLGAVPKDYFFWQHLFLRQR